MKAKAISEFENSLFDISSLEFEVSNEIVDNEYRIDIELNPERPSLPESMKPNSHSNMRSKV